MMIYSVENWAVAGELTFDNSQGASRILLSSSRTPAVDPRIFHPSECTPRGSYDPGLAISANVLDQ